jgi:hypothetical protein
MNTEMRNSDRYRGFEADSSFGALLIESGNIIDLAAKPEATRSNSIRIVTWTNNKGEKCHLQSQQMTSVDINNHRGKKPITHIDYILIRDGQQYQYGSDMEQIYICDGIEANPVSARTRPHRAAGLLEILGTFNKEEALAARYDYWIGEVNEKFQEIVADNQEFDRKIGKTILGRVARITPAKLRKAMPHIDDHTVARYMADVV